MNQLFRHIRVGRRASAFTLIELLTVIAIIGILAAILIPTIGSVRESARNATCKTRIRQWSTAFMLYANENRGAYLVSEGGRVWCQVGSGSVYSRYMNVNPAGTTFGDKIPYCPSFDETAVKGLHTPASTCYVAIVPHLNGATVNAGKIPLNRATTPAKTMMLIERQHVTSTGLLADLGGGAADLSLRLENASVVRGQYPSFARHGRKANVVFMDGHVISMTWNNGNPNTSLMRDPVSGGNGVFETEWLRLDR